MIILTTLLPGDETACMTAYRSHMSPRSTTKGSKRGCDQVCPNQVDSQKTRVTPARYQPVRHSRHKHKFHPILIQGRARKGAGAYRAHAKTSQQDSVAISTPMFTVTALCQVVASERKPTYYSFSPHPKGNNGHSAQEKHYAPNHQNMPRTARLLPANSCPVS